MATQANGQEKGTQVTLTDGRAVTFAGKKQIDKAFKVDDQGNIEFTFDFVNGETRSLVIENDDPIILNLAGHGGLQKLGDEMAAGKDVPLEDRIVWLDELVGRLSDRTKTVDERWYSSERGGGGGGVRGMANLIKALMELNDQSLEEVKDGIEAAIKRLNVTKQGFGDAMSANNKVKPIIERLEKERLAKVAPIDTSAELAALGVV